MPKSGSPGGVEDPEVGGDAGDLAERVLPGEDTRPPGRQQRPVDVPEEQHQRPRPRGPAADRRRPGSRRQPVGAQHLVVRAARGNVADAEAGAARPPGAAAAAPRDARAIISPCPPCDVVIVEREDDADAVNASGEPLAVDAVQPRQVDHPQADALRSRSSRAAWYACDSMTGP